VLQLLVPISFYNAVYITQVGDGGCTAEQLAAIMVEQQRAKGEFPGPCPVLLDGAGADPLRLAEAAAAGCTGVTLDLGRMGAEAAAKQAATAAHLGLEVVLFAEPTAESVAAACALAGETGLVCLRADSVAAALDAAVLFPDGVLKATLAPVADVREAWALRDVGYSTLFLANSLLLLATIERVEIQTILKAMRSKGSAKFGKGSNLGRGECAKEVLGSMSV